MSVVTRHLVERSEQQNRCTDVQLDFPESQFNLASNEVFPTICSQQYQSLKQQFPNGMPLATWFRFEQSFGDAEIAHILHEFEAWPLSQAGTVSGILDPTYRTSTIKWIPRSTRTEWLYRKIWSMGMWCREKWDFDIRCMGEPIQIAKYEEHNRGFYDWHTDSGSSNFSSLRKISMSVQLSDPTTYDGGDLQFRINRETVTAPRTRGTVVAFPSYFLHRVTPVTRGTRYSLVLWLTGPPFR